MIPIHPICPENIMPHIGKPACAVLNDGTCVYGMIRDVRDGRLFFDHGGPMHVSSINQKKTNKASVKNRKFNSNDVKAKTSAFFPFRGFGLGFATGISLGLISSLFLFPFFFI